MLFTTIQGDRSAAAWLAATTSLPAHLLELPAQSAAAAPTGFLSDFETTIPRRMNLQEEK
jgi:hypothetical protein